MKKRILSFALCLVMLVSCLGVAPSRSISREELAVMMYRYAKYRGQEGTVKGDLLSDRIVIP